MSIPTKKSVNAMHKPIRLVLSSLPIRASLFGIGSLPHRKYADDKSKTDTSHRNNAIYDIADILPRH